MNVGCPATSGRTGYSRNEARGQTKEVSRRGLYGSELRRKRDEISATNTWQKRRAVYTKRMNREKQDKVPPPITWPHGCPMEAGRGANRDMGAISPAIHNHTITEDFHAIHQDCRTTVGVVRGVLE